MVATAKQSADVTMGELAREALAMNGGDTDLAVAALVERLSNDSRLLRAIVRDAVKDAIVVRVEMAMRNTRAAILKTTTGGRGAVVALASGISRALLDMPLANGLPLRNATRAQVLEQADRYAATAKDATHKAKWLQAIAQSVPDGKRVGDVMNDERAAELFRETAK